MSKVNFSITMASGLSLCFAFSFMVHASGSLPVLEVESRSPLKLSVFEQGKSYDLSPPSDFMREIEGVYEDVHVEDLTGDGIGEVVFDLAGGRVNSCSRVLHYTDSDRSLSELVFSGGGLCDFKVRHGYVVSSYKDGAAWAEDVYVVKDGKVDIKISDRCVGCGEVVRKEYHPDGSFVRLLVSDDVDFEKRIPLITKVASLQAWIFSSLGAAQPTGKYLIRGDEITILGGGKARGEEWVEFRFSGRATTEGWLKCSDLDSCNEF
ncbi:hypothetical protein [Pseudomonas sp. EL_65y_Pfl1_R32]|uniref:hypothetical protein n=1 Tax=Pseudomonas sp. EL_65y_Pfl1_R32 TaxID=3088696 RepID=UPI0030DC28BF